MTWRFFLLLLPLLWLAACTELAGEAEPPPPDQETAPETAKDVAEDNVSAVFISEAGVRLVAAFDRAAETVRLILGDEPPVTLPLVVSGSGARYASGGRVFWEHKGSARYWVDGRLIFTGPKEKG